MPGRLALTVAALMTLGAAPSVRAESIASAERPSRTWTWVAAGTSAALAAAAMGVSLSMRSRFEDLDRSCGSRSPTWPGCPESDIAALHRRTSVADALWGLAGATALTSFVLYFLEGQPVEVRASASPGGASLAAGARF
jgi:hypothetical protein